MGKPFDPEEPATKGVEVSVVDRSWSDLDGYNGLIFGDFRQFKSSAFTQATVYGLGEKITFYVNSTFKIAKLPQLLFPLLWLSWMVSVICSLAFSTSVPLWFYLVSLAAFLSSLLLHKYLNNESRALLFTFYKLFNLSNHTCFITGVAMVHILISDCKGPSECLVELIFLMEKTASRQRHSVWEYHFFIFAVLAADISVDVVLLVVRYFYFEESREESQTLLPGQKKAKQHSVSRIIVSAIPLIGGITCATVVVLSTEKSIFKYFPLLSGTFTILGIAHVSTFAYDFWVGGVAQRAVYVLLLLISFSSYDINLRWVAFSLIWFCNLYKNAEYHYCHCSCVFTEPCTGVTILFIEKVMLNFSKLISALEKKFSSLKL